jgi:hypothetical protein
MNAITEELFTSCQNDDLERLKKALANGADIHAQNDRAIEIAWSLPLIRYLIENGIDVRAADDIASKRAALFESGEIMEYLAQLIFTPSIWKDKTTEDIEKESRLLVEKIHSFLEDDSDCELRTSYARTTIEQAAKQAIAALAPKK